VVSSTIAASGRRTTWSLHAMPATACVAPTNIAPRSNARVVHRNPHPTGGQCRGDPVGRPAGPWRTGSRDDAMPSYTIAPGRRTAWSLHAMPATACVAPTNIAPRRNARVVHRNPHPTGGQCTGDPVGRPAGPWRTGTRDDAVPSYTIAPGRRTASPLHAPRVPPSPGAARRPLPGRERRLLSAVQLRRANHHSVAPSHVDSSPSPWLG